jgi:RNA polymerase sigma-70 factor (sigma-E family)
MLRASAECDQLLSRKSCFVTGQRDAHYTEYIAFRLPALRRLALLLCQDRHRADDLVQQAIIKVYVHWSKASGADNTDAYVNAILVREFLHDQRSAWTRRVSVVDQPPESPILAIDQDRQLDLQTAVAALAPRQRAVLILRYYCDLNIDQTAAALGCSTGTVKSQTARALAALRTRVARDEDVVTATADARTSAATRGPAGKASPHA